MLEMLRAGKTARDVADAFGWPMTYASTRCTVLRKRHGLPTIRAPELMRQAPTYCKELTPAEMRAELVCKLGREWVTRMVGTDNESAELVRLYTALRAELQDVRAYMLAVRARLSALRGRELADVCVRGMGECEVMR